MVSGRVMQRTFLKIAAIAILMSPVAYGQSLGDVARENREKKAQDAPAVQPKVITNTNLPKDPDAKPESPDAEPGASAPDDSKAAHRRSEEQRSADRRFAAQRRAELRATDQWKRQILEQEGRISTLQARIDKLHASIHFVDSNAFSQGVAYNRYQARQMEREAQMQEQLGEEKNKLEQMQEAARHAGMHTPVYDP